VGQTLQSVDKAMMDDRLRKEYRRHLRFEPRTDRKRREFAERRSVAYHAKLNYAMRLHLWQKSMDTLLEVEEILTKHGHDLPQRVPLRLLADEGDADERRQVEKAPQKKRFEKTSVPDLFSPKGPWGPPKPPGPKLTSKEARGLPSYSL
jgi:hypothetical protein